MTIQKEAAFIGYLTKLTKSGEITWYRSEPPEYLTNGTSNKVIDFFRCQVKGRAVGLYEVRVPSYDPDRDTFHWHGERELALFDDLGNHEYSFRANAGVSELFSSVKGNVAGVDDFLDDVLGEGPH
jgi:hypothetical protein